jgi:hypothetical protein
MDMKQTSPAPDIVAITAVRDLSDRSRALEALSGDVPVRERVAPVLVLWAAFAAIYLNEKHHLVEIEVSVFVAFLAILAVATGLSMAMFHLRRQVKALTYLLLQREREDHDRSE